MNLKIVAAGKLKTPGAALWVDHFKNRISFWRNRYRIEIQEIKSGPSDSDRVIEAVTSTKGGRLIRILLDEQGKNWSSQEWASHFEKWEQSGVTNVVIGIGGSYGFSKEALRDADEVVSLGRGTFSHELARVVLIEQLYRTCAIRQGHPYHHE